jgi:hypothetical protein
MNRYARAVITEFMSDQNEKFLANKLLQHFNDTRVYEFINQQLHSFMYNFAAKMQEELSLSDPMPGISLLDQLNCFNRQFLADRANYIRAFVLKDDDRRPMYMVKDDIPTSRHGIKHFQQPANNILNSWTFNAAPGLQVREDPSGDVSYVMGRSNGNTGGGPHGYGSVSNGARSYNPYYSQDNSAMATGIVFCDQSDLGTSNHLELFDTSYVRNLNNDPQPHTNDMFGNATPASDARLLSRRIFRNNERGVENGIPVYEQRLYRRNLETNIDEALRPGERGCMVHGYDMAELRSRVDYKNDARRRFEPQCDNRTQSQLQFNTMATPQVQAGMRYC